MVIERNRFADIFTDKPDFKPYKALPEDDRIFNVEKILMPPDKNFNWSAVKNSPDMDDPDDMRKWSAEDFKELKESIKLETQEKTAVKSR